MSEAARFKTVAGKKVTEHVRMSTDGMFHCLNCNECYQMNLPVPIPIIVAAMREWLKLHRTCKKILGEKPQPWSKEEIK